MTSTTKLEERKLERPRWTRETPMSRLVGALITFKPLFSLMKLRARQVAICFGGLIKYGGKIKYSEEGMTREILESEVYEEFERIRDLSLVYPDYYLNPFHAYDEGNLSWLAAAEAEAATLPIAK